MPKWIGGEVRGKIRYERSTVAQLLGASWRGHLVQDDQDGHWFPKQYAIRDEYGNTVDRRVFDNYDFNPNRDKSWGGGSR